MIPSIEDREDCIAALATAMGESALALIRTSGKGCLDRLAVCTDRPGALKAAKSHRIVLAHFIDPQSGEEIDQVLIAVYRAPRSYSGEDSAEISCHGNPNGIVAILEVLYRNGFRPAAGGEFTLRAFLNGKMDLTRAEAVQEIVSARTRTSQVMALQRLNGSIEREVNQIKSGLVSLMAAVSIQLDYPEDETGPIPLDRASLLKGISRLETLSSTYASGRLYQQGAVVALAGRTNAGKSSLFNLFLKEERAIVSPIHGTTRDYLEASASLSGIPLRLYDTAGLRASLEEIESEGIRRTAKVIERADLILYLVDASRGIAPEDEAQLAELEGRKFIKVWNKIDVPDAGPLPEGWVALSTARGEGFSDLEREILALLDYRKPSEEVEAVIDSARQKECLERAAEALRLCLQGLEDAMPLDAIALDLQTALNALGELTGEVTREDILDRMFSNFCVGK